MPIRTQQRPEGRLRNAAARRLSDLDLRTHLERRLYLNKSAFVPERRRRDLLACTLCTNM